MTRSKQHMDRMFWLVAGMVAILIATALPSAWGQTAATPSIKFLSPTSFAGEVPVVTDTTGSGGVNASFRLSAWTANAPQGSLVEFELVPGDIILTKPMTIGAGQPVADDTFEYQWDIAEGPTGVSEGLHDLKATLYDANSEELAVDTIRVNVLHGTTEAQQDDNVPSLDIAYPVSGGPMGQFTAPNGRTNSVIDGKTSKVSPAGYSVQAWFTTSSPGTAPVWKLCNAGEDDLSTGLPDGVDCVYPIDNPDTKEINEAVDPTRVTAVGLAGKKREDGTADVVRVMPYAQDPTSLTSVLLAKGQPTKAPSSSGAAGNPVQKKDDAGLWPCSDWLRVKVTDQVGRTIAAANLDAHAQGPTDQLKFHNGILSASPRPVFQPPSEAHSFPEAATSCTSTANAAAQQGEHGLGGQPDRKHVETVAGSRDNGVIDYALQPDQPGTTQLTVWVDEKDDDRFCSGEPSVAAGFGWGMDQAPTPQSEQPADCVVIPDPEPTDEEPFDGTRTAAIEPSATAVKAGRTTSIVGSIDAAEELCEAGQTLKLKAKKATARRFRTIATATTDAFGLAAFDVKVERTKVYRVVAPAAGECALAKSTIRKIRAI